MPFVSQAQRRACWAKYKQDLKARRKPQWDCAEWENYSNMNSGTQQVLQYLNRFPELVVQQMIKKYGLNSRRELAQYYLDQK